MTPLPALILTHEDAVRIERPENDAWLDMYAAMPDTFRREFGADIVDIDGVLVTRCKALPFVHFNAALSLGLHAPATEQALDDVMDAYRRLDIRRFTVLHHEHCRPPELPQWLVMRGFEPRAGWDRVHRLAGPPLPDAPPSRGEIGFVTTADAGAWASFLVGMYRLPTEPWLRALVGRAGWTHAVLTRGGVIVAARSLFVNTSGEAWLGVEAPVPGIMAPSFDDDHVLIDALMREALRLGATTFTADVELPHDGRATPPYTRWRELGFGHAYRRTHFLIG
ncbi:MAG: hypothetical protein U0Q12_28440 [Vicinamibacterales bacterium]